ncbi:WD40-repeat-containing domain protein [Hysterangium stoloniferum]|nr:WD40-repeat-containing domain protein [Hysterangium stoloniferum]
MVSALETFIYSFLPELEDHYGLVASLNGPGGPVNAFAFNTGSTLLASGGDDEEVRIWDLKTHTLFQMLVNNNQYWGQITTINFINQDATPPGIEWLCFITGCGQFLVYCHNRKASDFTKYIHQENLSLNDSIESFAFDPSAQHLAITSHYGQLKVFQVDHAHLTKLWEDSLPDVIPRAVSFPDEGTSVIVYVMETGMISCKDTETATEKYNRPLKSAIGNVDICASSGNALIDNMGNGFDLYPANHTTPMRTFKVHTQKNFVKAGVFAERGKAVVCGSNHGKAYVFGIDNRKLQQILRHGGAEQMIQAAMSSQSSQIIVTGASTGKYNIRLWKKRLPTQPVRVEHRRPQCSDFQFLMNIVVILLLTIWTSNAWLPPIKEQYETFTSRISTNNPGYIETIQAMMPQHSEPSMNFMELIHSMEDDTLHRVFKMEMGPQLTEMYSQDIAENTN